MTDDVLLRWAMSQRLSLRKFKRARSIFYQGEIPRAAYIIKEGMARAFDINESGEERVITYYTKGDILPLGWVFDKSPVALYNYDASTDCELYVLSKEQIQKCLQEDSELLRRLFDRFMTHYIGATMHIHALEHSFAQDKLIKILQYLVLRFGQQQKRKGVFKLGLRLTQQDIANMVGMTRETAAIELNKLKKRKIISYKSFYYTVDMNALLRATGEDEFYKVEL